MNFKSKYRSQHETVFESFSDMVLCVVIVLVTLIITLALNVQRDVPSNNIFTGGDSRPRLFLQAGVADPAVTEGGGSSGRVMVHLFSPSAAEALTKVEDGKVIARNANQTFFGQLDLSVWQFLQLAAGIDPGRFDVKGMNTSLLLPKFVSKVILHGDGFREVSDTSLALNVMKLAWPVYQLPLYTVRSSGEFNDARTRIYVETMTRGDERYLYIGNMVFNIPEDVQNGALSWLEGMASGSTEIVFLGEMWSNPAQRTDKRVAFFEASGYIEAADAYCRSVFDASAADYAVAQKAVSDALIAGKAVHPEHLPSLLAHPDAWTAYVQDCQSVAQSPTASAPEPPEWFLEEVLRPLGFDRRIIKEPSAL